ncbi:MAG: hypothetical protein ACYDDE_00725 [bacterium]
MLTKKELIENIINRIDNEGCKYEYCISKLNEVRRISRRECGRYYYMDIDRKPYHSGFVGIIINIKKFLSQEKIANLRDGCFWIN